MAYLHFIPKIEYLKSTLTGTTSIGSPIVTGIADTGSVVTGAPYNMFFEGTGIPAGALVLSKTSTTVTLDKNATVAATNIFTFGHRIQFDYPPKKEPIGENPKWVGSVSTSKSGLTQYMEDFIEIETSLEFSHISQDIKDRFEYFLLTHCLRGSSFSFYRDYLESASEEIVEKNDNYTSPSFKIITRKGAGYNFLWSFKFAYRKVYGT
jgi:hypothetical protein